MDRRSKVELFEQIRREYEFGCGSIGKTVKGPMGHPRRNQAGGDLSLVLPGLEDKFHLFAVIGLMLGPKSMYANPQFSEAEKKQTCPAAARMRLPTP
jgi:hypothetical protein